MEEKQSKFWDFYNKNYKKLLIIPMIVLILSIVLIYNFYRVNGDIIHKEVSLKGGITVTVYYKERIDVNELNNFLIERFNNADVNTRLLSSLGTSEVTGFIIETSDIKPDELKKALEEKLSIKLNDKNYSIEEVGSSLGESFYKEMLYAVLFAFLFMALVVFITFRLFVPSFAIVLCAFSDIVTTLAIVDLIGLRIGTSGIAAFLMLIGYSIDTDILLTTRVLKRKEGSVIDRFRGAFKTGLTLSIATIIALSVAFIFTNSIVLKQIFLIIVIGLIADIFYTWVQNGCMLYWYAMKKEHGN